MAWLRNKLAELVPLRLTVGRKISIAVGGVLLLGLLCAGIHYYEASRQYTDGRLIDWTGQLRMLSQRAAKDALLAAAGSKQGTRQYRRTSERYETLRMRLLESDSGSAEGSLIRDPSTRRQLRVVDSLWHALDRQVSPLLSTSHPVTSRISTQRLEQIHATSDSLQASAHKVVTALRQRSTSGIATIARTSTLLFVLQVLVAGGMYYGIRKEIVLPIRDLTRGARKLSQGDRDVSIPVQTDCEVGELAEAFNAMADDIQRREQELLAAKESAEEADRLKGSILQNLSHEFRTPLTTIIGFADTLSSDLDEHQAELIELIRADGERLLHTLSTMLEYAQLESGVRNIEYESAELVGICEPIVDLHRRLAERNGLTLTADLPEPPVYRHLDKSLLKTVLHNLLSNAVKFTDSGSITVSIQARDSILIEVTDSGIGMSTEKADRMTDPFRQASNGTTREYQGTGLGLTVTERLVNRIDGHMHIESQPGEGTSIRLRLPLPVPEGRDVPVTVA